MSFLKKYLKGWTLRTDTPELVPGETVNVFVSEYDEVTGEGLAFIGDTRLRVEDFDPEYVDHRVAVRVIDYDADANEAIGEYREAVGESSYTG